MKHLSIMQHLNRPAHLHIGRRKIHSGFSLIVTLILLAVVTLLGIGASQIVLLAERSTRFQRDYQIAFQAAEAALIDAEFDIRGPNTAASQRMSSFSPTEAIGFVDGCGDTAAARGLCNPVASGSNPIWYTVDFTDTSTTAKTAQFGEFTGRAASLSTGSTGIRPAILPRYIIEVIPDTTPGTSASGALRLLYRVTAMGFGPRTETQAVVQMIFRKE